MCAQPCNAEAALNFPQSKNIAATKLLIGPQGCVRPEELTINSSEPRSMHNGKFLKTSGDALSMRTDKHDELSLS